MTLVYVVLGALVLLAVWAILTYNGLIKLRTKVDEAWSGVDVQLKRRHDLVPNLVETVRGYAAHERETLGFVTRARTAALAADSKPETQQAESQLSSALTEVRALAEAYPELKAAESFRRLQTELAQIEDELQAARRIYNANVQDFNTRIQVFPDALIARPLAFVPRSFFRLDTPADRAVPAAAF